MKHPVGECRFCGREFMYKQSLYKHETENCPERKSEPGFDVNPVTSGESDQWKRRQMMGNRTVWVPRR